MSIDYKLLWNSFKYTNTDDIIKRMNEYEHNALNKLKPKKVAVNTKRSQHIIKCEKCGKYIKNGLWKCWETGWCRTYMYRKCPECGESQRDIMQYWDWKEIVDKWTEEFNNLA